jgi:asparagine synthase (glutamine-hydrolysing)
MCGIWSFLKLIDMGYNPSLLTKLFHDFMTLENRGPEHTSLKIYKPYLPKGPKEVWVGHQRLSIVDPTVTSDQPFIIKEKNKTIVFICNGEVYDFKDLITDFELTITQTSDCMTIPELYLKVGYDAFLKLFDRTIKGEFAFILYEFDEKMVLKKLLVGRDQIGIRPLYYHPVDKTTQTMIFSSEIKGTINYIYGPIQEFPPGNIITYSFNDFGRIEDISTYSFKWVYSVEPSSIKIMKTLFKDNTKEPFEIILLDNIRESIFNSVKRRLQADRPIGFLLSGGVDSSLVAGISASILDYPIRTFCCGMNEGTDLLFARKVAEHIKSIHTEVIFTPEEALAAIPDVIYTVETWDTTTVRASVGQYLISKYIGTETDIKVVGVGEGPDEVCSSYMFNWSAPSGEALHQTALEYVDKIHYYDSKRGDRCLSRWGLEGRVPLLDPEFIEAYWKVPSEMRMPTYKKMEKWWLRQAFADTKIIPDEVLWRKKEAFSDGVSGKEKSWFQIIQEYIEPLVSDDELSHAVEVYPYQTPKTKEAYYYRKLFCHRFGKDRQNVIPKYWQPKWDSIGNEITEYIDPSARVLKVYESH